MEVARVDPGLLDAVAIGFRLAPRINAAGRLHRADAGLELLLTEDTARARAIAAELDAVNTERRDVETRILFAAEAQVAEQGPAPAYVLAAEDWHPGVIGIVASRIAERHHRPAVLIALDGAEGTGSGRSIPAFDLLGGLTAASSHLDRYGGHRAAAGLTIGRDAVDAFRRRFTAHAAEVLTPDDLVPECRIDAVVPGDALTLGLAEELERLAPFGQGNPAVSLMVPAAELTDPRPLGEGRHVAFALHAGGARSRCVRFGAGNRLPVAQGELADVAVRLEANRWNGSVEPRLVLRHARPAGTEPIQIIGEPDFQEGLLRELSRDLAGTAADTGPGRARDEGRSPPSWPRAGGPAAVPSATDARGQGIGGLLAGLVSTDEPVLAIVAHAPHRARVLSGRVGGFAVCSWAALHDDPGLAAPYQHLVAVDPPADPALLSLLERPSAAARAHLAWGEPELRFALRIHEWEFALREPLKALYRALRGAGTVGGEALEAVLRGEGPQPRSAALAGRLVRVLTELDLVVLDREGPALRIAEAPARTALERSAAFGAYHQRLEDGQRYLTSETTRRQAA
jgi:single-stranded-DNA-specific exonuclease